MKETDQISICDAAKRVASASRKYDFSRKEYEAARLAYSVAKAELCNAREALETEVADLVDRS